jgi:ligand-binding sensor domain-containing protein
MRFRHLTVEDGLPSGSVSALLQDRAGYVWIGVHGGLCRYDGVRLESFFHEDADPRSLSSNLVTALAEDLSGRIWVGTDKGVNVLGAARDTFARYAPAAFGGAGGDPQWITALACDPSGDVWISSGSGLVRHDARTGSFRLFRAAANRVPAPPFWGIAPAGEGRVWLGSSAGLDEFDAGSGSVVRHVERFGPSGPRAIVGALRRDDAGLLWVGTIDGLVRFDPVTGASRLFRKELARVPAAGTNTMSPRSARTTKGTSGRRPRAVPSSSTRARKPWNWCAPIPCGSGA